MPARRTIIAHLPRPPFRARQRASVRVTLGGGKFLPLSRRDLPFRNRGVGYLGLKASPSVWPDGHCGKP